MTVSLSQIIDALCDEVAERIAAKLREPAPTTESNPITTPAAVLPVTPVEAVPAPIAPAPTPPPAPVKLEQLMLDLVRKIGREKVIAALAERGVKKASELTGDNLRGFRAWAEDEIGANNV